MAFITYLGPGAAAKTVADGRFATTRANTSCLCTSMEQTPPWPATEENLRLSESISSRAAFRTAHLGYAAISSTAAGSESTSDIDGIARINSFNSYCTCRSQSISAGQETTVIVGPSGPRRHASPTIAAAKAPASFNRRTSSSALSDARAMRSPPDVCGSDIASTIFRSTLPPPPPLRAQHAPNCGEGLQGRVPYLCSQVRRR